VNLSDFDYALPPDRVALHPAEPRDSARLLVVDRRGGAPVDAQVRDLPGFLEPGDLLVVNDTKVLHARLFGRRASGGRVELLLIRREGPGTREALLRAHRSLPPGERLALDGGITATLLERTGPGPVWRVALECDGDLEAAIERAGHVPLPPYIRRADLPEDRARYQTVFAARPGSAAAPTAGLHFTEGLLARLAERGVGVARITLHVGYGTFQPIEVERVEEHRMHAEEFEVTAEAARAIRERKGRCVAVGTTAARVVESLAASGGIRAARGRTDLFLYPGRPFRAVEALLTNFHLPKSSLLLLVCAFAGRERVLEAYAHAIERGYRFYSYGDASLFL